MNTHKIHGPQSTGSTKTLNPNPNVISSNHWGSVSDCDTNPAGHTGPGGCKWLGRCPGDVQKCKSTNRTVRMALSEQTSPPRAEWPTASRPAHREQNGWPQAEAKSRQTGRPGNIATSQGEQLGTWLFGAGGSHSFKFSVKSSVSVLSTVY